VVSPPALSVPIWKGGTSQFAYSLPAASKLTNAVSNRTLQCFVIAINGHIETIQP
jgi:hypothetical protein